MSDNEHRKIRCKLFFIVFQWVTLYFIVVRFSNTLAHMNENTVHNKRTNSIVFGMVMLSSILLASVSNTSFFRNNPSIRMVPKESMPNSMQFPVLGFLYLQTTWSSNTEHFTVQ